MTSFKGQTAFITGSSRGIGLAIAESFAKAGANIVLNARSVVSQEAIDQITQHDVEVKVVLGDVSDFEQAEKMITEAKEAFGSLDILVNNAGITRDKLLMRMTEEDFDQVINANLKGTFNMIRHASKVMLKQKSGSIINISSVVGETGNTGQANYAASKAGVLGLTKSTARELASRGITCNAICPGFIKSDMTDQIPEKMQDAMMEQIPLKRFGEVEEIASTCVFLAQNKYITGATIDVNGGMYM